MKLIGIGGPKRVLLPPQTIGKAIEPRRGAAQELAVLIKQGHGMAAAGGDRQQALVVKRVVDRARGMFLQRCRPLRHQRALDFATLGVKKIYLINSYRVEKSYWQTPLLTEDAIREHLLLGLEQGCDTVMPEVTLVKRFKPFVEDNLKEIVGTSRALVAHPYTDTPCPAQIDYATTLAIGPEGGFIPYEIDLLEKCGFAAVNLGKRIMRVETVVPYLLGRLFN